MQRLREFAAPQEFSPRPETSVIACPRSVSVWLFGLSLMFAPLNGLQLVQYVSWSDAFLLFAVATGVVEYALAREPIQVELPYIFVFICLLVPMLAGGLRGELLFAGAFLVSSLALALIPLGAGILRVNSWSEVGFMMLLWTMGGVVGVLYIVLSVNGLLGNITDPHWEVHGRSRGLTFHPSLAGRCVLLTLPGLFLGFFVFRSWLVRIVLLLLILMTLKALDYTGTRAAFISAVAFAGLFLTLAGFMLWSRRVGIRLSALTGLLLLVLAAFALVALATSSGLIEPIFERIWDRLFGSNIPAIASSRIREEFSAQAIAGFLESPWVGQGYQWSVFTSSSVAHNIYLQYLQVGGVMGFAALMTFLLYPTWLLWQRINRPVEQFGRMMGVLLVSVIAAIMLLIAGQSGFNDYSSISVFCLALILVRSSKLWDVSADEGASGAGRIWHNGNK